MSNIILTGAAGRMGQAILSILPSFRGMHLVGAIESSGHPQSGKAIYKNIKLTSDLAAIVKNCDVVVDFTGAESSITNLKMAASSGRACIIGATGHDSTQRAEIMAMSKIVPVVFSSNMSVGVNAMWRLIGEAVKMLGKKYQIDIVETHHVHKKDKPSGTAKKMIEIVTEKGGYELNKNLLVTSIREGEVVGDHTIIFTNPNERLEITHHAFSRETFANGALRAAEWIVDKKPGLYDMADVLGR